MIGVSVPNDVGNAMHQYGGLAASRTRQHEQRPLGGEYGAALHFVERGIRLVKQGALGREITLGEILIHRLILSM